MAYEKWQNVNNMISKQDEMIKKIRFSISGVLAIIGVFILSTQLIPLLNSYITGEIYKYKQNNIATPIPDSYKEELNEEFGYDPGKSYFQNLFKNANLSYSDVLTYDPSTKQYREVVVNKDYSNDMSLSISKIGINNITVKSNIDSYNESIYNSALVNGLAHFKGTPLPGDGGNSFIYGHSSLPSFFNLNQNNPEVIFSKLENIEIGDSIQIEKDNQLLYYTVRKKKITDPNDFSILAQQGDKETLTLMTCWPLGIGTQRLIVIAERDE